MGFSHVSSVFTDIHYNLPPVTDWHHAPWISVEHAHPVWPPIGCLLHVSHPTERLSQARWPLSAISPALSAGHGKRLDGLFYQSQIIRNLRAVSRHSLDTVWRHLYSVLTTRWGMLDILWLAGFPGSHSVWRTVLPCLQITHYLSPLLLTRFPSQRCPESNATSNPLYFLLLCQHHQFAGDISETQQDECTAQDHTACNSVNSGFFIYWSSCSFIKQTLVEFKFVIFQE